MRRAYECWSEEDLREEVSRLSAVDPSNIYCGLAGYTVGESLELAEAELALRQ